MSDTAPVTGETPDAGVGEGCCWNHPHAAHETPCATPDADDASDRKGRRHVTTTRSVGTATVALDDLDDSSTGASEGLTESEKAPLRATVHDVIGRSYGFDAICRQVERIVAARVSAAATRAADDRAERIAQAIEATAARHPNHPCECRGCASYRYAAQLARSTP